MKYMSMRSGNVILGLLLHRQQGYADNAFSRTLTFPSRDEHARYRFLFVANVVPHFGLKPNVTHLPLSSDVYLHPRNLVTLLLFLVHFTVHAVQIIAIR